MNTAYFLTPSLRLLFCWLLGLAPLLLVSLCEAQTTYAHTLPQKIQPDRKLENNPSNSFSDQDEPKKAAQPLLKVFKYQKDGVVSYSDKAPMRTRYEVVTYSCFACNPASRVDWYSIKLYPDAYNYPITMAAKKYEVDPALVRAVIHAESAFRESVVSRKGAVGLMQLMPKTASEMGVKDSLAPTQNIHGGVKYLALLLKLYDGNVMLATAAYNAGPGAVKRHQGIPPYAETKAYVKRVRILHQRYKDQNNELALETGSHQSL